MPQRVALMLVWVCVAATVVGFVMPWARLDVREPGLLRSLTGTGRAQEAAGALMKGLGTITATVRRGTETVAGELPSLADIPTQVRGVQIPQMANQENAKVAMALTELLMNERQHLGAKSYAVYLLPGLALLCGLLLTWLGRTRVAVGRGVAGLCALVAGGGFWKLLTIDTETLFIAISIGPGLWLSVWAYVGLGVAALAGFGMRRPAPH